MSEPDPFIAYEIKILERTAAKSLRYALQKRGLTDAITLGMVVYETAYGPAIGIAIQFGPERYVVNAYDAPLLSMKIAHGQTGATDLDHARAFAQIYSDPAYQKDLDDPVYDLRIRPVGLNTPRTEVGS